MKKDLVEIVWFDATEIKIDKKDIENLTPDEQQDFFKNQLTETQSYGKVLYEDKYVVAIIYEENDQEMRMGFIPKPWIKKYSKNKNPKQNKSS